MALLDMKTLLLDQVATYFICMLVVGLLWQQNRRRFRGLDLWLLSFLMHTLSIVLIILRSAIPGWLSIVIGGSVLPLGATILFYIGLEQFVGRPTRQYHNLAFLLVSMAVHAYFTFVQLDLVMRNINFSFFVMLIHLQVIWLMLRRVDAGLRPITGLMGYIFIAAVLIDIARIAINLAEPAGNDFLRANNTPDTFLILFYQAVFYASTFALFLMINKRLFLELQLQHTALQKSEVRYRQLVEFLPNALFVFHAGKFDLLNSAALKLMRAAHPEQLLGKPVLDVVHASYRPIANERIETVLASGQTAPLLEEKLIRLDGSIVDVEVTTAPFEYQGQPALQSIVRDITERKRAEAVLQLRLKLLEFAAAHSLSELMQMALDEIGLLTNSPIGFYHFVEEDQKTLTLQAWSTRTRQEFCRAEGAGMVYDLDLAGVWVECIYRRGPVIHNDYAALPNRKGLPAGHAEVTRELVVPTIQAGRIVSILGIGNKPTEYDESDITLVSYIADVIWGIVERKRTESQLQTYQAQLEAHNLELRKLWLAIEQSGNTVVITDAQGAIQYANPSFEQTSGYRLSEVIGQNPRFLRSGEQTAEFYRNLWETITGGQIWHGEFLNRRKDGGVYWEATTIAPVQDDAGMVTSYIAIKADVTERKRMEANLERLATTDALTGALNRRQLTLLADRELERAHRYQHPTSIIMLDIDHFKRINDQYGHAAGDQAIQKTAQILLENLRGADYLGRYGGDEFLIVLPETDRFRAQQAAERIRVQVANLPVLEGEPPIHFTVSLGVVCVTQPAAGAHAAAGDPATGDPAAGAPAITFNSAVQFADQALYRAKAAGRNCVWVVDPPGEL
ncbi:MAG: diguanylate cyclase [Chloroflexota bacterium]